MIRLMKKMPGKTYIVAVVVRTLLLVLGAHAALAENPARNEEYYLPLATDSADTLQRKGKDSNKLHEYGFAIPLYEALLKRGGTKNLLWAYEGLGVAYAGKAQFPKAFDYLDKAVVLARKSKNTDELSEALRGRARIHVSNKEYDLALADMNESLKLAQSDGRWVERAEIFMHLRQYDKAAADYSEAIKVAPEKPQLYYDRAKAYRLSNNAVAAKRDLDKGNELSEKNF
jgi:tetratricopeptide (TPR) repeat protein